MLIDALFSEAVLIDQQIYEAFRAEVQKLKDSTKNPQPRLKWSSDLLNKLKKPPQRIWVTETLWCNSAEELMTASSFSSDEILHDLTLLGFNITDKIDENLLRQVFLESRIWRWLEHKLKCTPNREMYYGQLSAELHNSFLDDPKPYRKDVKGLLTNLLNWSTSLANDFIFIDRPNYSQRIKLQNSMSIKDRLL